MPLKAMMAKPIIQYPVYAVASDDDTERSNLTSILKPMPLKAKMAKPRNPNPEKATKISLVLLLCMQRRKNPKHNTRHTIYNTDLI